MKKRMLTRIMTFILSMALCFNLVQTPVFAQENTFDVRENEFEVNNTQTQEKFYSITIRNDITGEISTHELLFLDDGSTILDEVISQNLGSEFTLIDIEEQSSTFSSEKLYFAEEGSIQPYAIETLFDIGCLVISAKEFYSNPSIWNGMFVILDGASVVLPFVPSVSGATRLIKNSGKLQDPLKHGVKTYRELQKVSSDLYQAHHIMPKKFAKLFGFDNHRDMFSIIIKKTDHSKITAKFNSNRYGLNGPADGYSRSYVKRQAERIYKDLYQETGDELYDFMARFIAESDCYGVR